MFLFVEVLEFASFRKMIDTRYYIIHSRSDLSCFPDQCLATCYLTNLSDGEVREYRFRRVYTMLSISPYRFIALKSLKGKEAISLKTVLFAITIQVGLKNRL